MHSAMSDEILEVFDWPPEGGGRTILFLGRFQRIIPGIVQALQHHQVPAGIDDDDGHEPIVLPGLRLRGSHDFVDLIQRDGGAVGGWRLRSGNADLEGE